jgi:hypothetical protein
MRFVVKIGEHFLKAFDGQRVGRQHVVIQQKSKTRRRANHQGEGDVARKCLTWIGQRIVAIKLTEGVGGGPLQFQQFTAQRQAGRHFAQRAFVGGESGGLQRAHHGKNLWAGLHAYPRLCAFGARLTLGLRGDGAAEQNDGGSEKNLR